MRNNAQSGFCCVQPKFIKLTMIKSPVSVTNIKANCRLPLQYKLRILLNFALTSYVNVINVLEKQT